LQFETEDEIKKHIEEKNYITIDNVNIHLHIVEPMIEAWFLADTKTLKSVLKIGKKTKISFNNKPEQGHSFQRIVDLLKQYFPENKKTPSKTILSKRFIDNGFTIQNSAKHKNCKSAKKFIEFIENLYKIDGFHR